MMVPFCQMSKKSEDAGFIAVYPNGTGPVGIFLTWNAGGLHGRMAEGKANDVKFVGSLLDDLATVVNIDPKRVYATGMSNGGMMCYRLAAELPDRIAAIAPVAGTMAVAEAKPNRPVPVMHFHGKADRIVPFGGPNGTPKFLSFKSVEETVEIWAKINGCRGEPVVEQPEDKAEDETTVTKKTYSPKESGAEVILVEIDGGGHTWPGVEPPVRFIGKSTKDISANDMIWEFFQRHRLQ
jgi:polyhydroxybutyrate depolymerase